MRITIIGGDDNSVYKDGVVRANLDLSGCGLPNDFWAFQWGEGGVEAGHIEFVSSLVDNQTVTEIPAWANACIAVLEAKIAEEEAEAAAAAAQQEV